MKINEKNRFAQLYLEAIRKGMRESELLELLDLKAEAYLKHRIDSITDDKIKGNSWKGGMQQIGFIEGCNWLKQKLLGE